MELPVTSQSHQHDLSHWVYHRARARSIVKLVMLFALGFASLLGSHFTSSLGFIRGGPTYLRNPDGYPDTTFLAAVGGRMLEQTATCEVECCQQYESEICGSENDWITAIPFAVQILLIVILISLSATFSGLTLGLMSLDKTGLQIVMGGDDTEAAGYAKIIYPVREDGNLLLCTLLLGNVAVNALLSILLAEYTGGVTGLLSSTFLIVIFGEIVPQALVSSFPSYSSSRQMASILNLP